jgi:hypothetical protein
MMMIILQFAGERNDDFIANCLRPNSAYAKHAYGYVSLSSSSERDYWFQTDYFLVSSYCSTERRCASQYFTVLHCASLCFTVLHCASLCFTVLHCASMCFTVLHCASLCFTVLHCASMCFSMLCSMTPFCNQLLMLEDEA